jgi:tetratricopeptide (TPR) repeat protein
MATDTAAAPRRLWQLPTFLVGLGALLALWHAGDRIRPSVGDRYKRAMQALRPAVDRWPADPDQIRAALRKVPDEEPPADIAPQVKYLTGSAYVALAETTNSPSEADEFWALARRDLEAAADHDLPVPDQKKLRYRLARTWANTPGTDPNRTIDALVRYISAGDDPSEGYRLLARLSLAKSPPDEVGGRDALQNFLKHANARADARTLNQARVDLASLHVKMGEGEDARKVLDRVGADAPPELYAAARLKIAGFMRSEDQWAEAATVLEQVRDMKGAKDEQREEAKARLAEAYVKLGRSGDAERIFKEVGNSDGPESAIAFFRQAEALLQDPAASKDAVILALEKSVAGRKQIPATDAKRVCETAFEHTRAASDFPRALRVIQVYAKLTDRGDHHRLAAECYQAWAESLSGTEAESKYRSAGDACLEASKVAMAPSAKVDWTRRAVGHFLKARDRAKAISMLSAVTENMTDYPVEQAGPAWVEIGDAFATAGEVDRARHAYQTAAGLPGSTRDRARVRYAAMSYEADPAKGGQAAAASLEEMFSRPPGESVDRSTLEEAAFLLGEVYLIQKEWEKADTRLRATLEAYPKSPRAARGRYHSGQVFRHFAYEAARKMKSDRAAIEQIKAERITSRQSGLKVIEEVRLLDQVDRSQKTFEDMMRKAFAEFARAEEMMLATPEAVDADVIRRTSFWAADCAYWIGEYSECATRCEKLMTRYRGKVEELEAARDLRRCCVFAAETARAAKDTASESAWIKKADVAVFVVRDSLGRVPPGEFDGKTESRRKEYWNVWLAEIGTRGMGGE